MSISKKSQQRLARTRGASAVPDLEPLSPMKGETTGRDESSYQVKSIDKRSLKKTPAKPVVGNIGIRSQHLLKLVPRMVAERTILKWSRLNSNLSADLLSEQLPFGQNLGEYLARAVSSEIEAPVNFEELQARDALIPATTGLLSPNTGNAPVVVMMVKLHNIYEVIDFKVGKTQVVESQMLESFASLIDEFLRIVSETVHKCPKEHEGDII